MIKNPQNSNPFIHCDDERSIENTICRVSDGLRMLQLTLSAGGESELTISVSQQDGVNHVINGMHEALGGVLNSIDELRRPELKQING